MGGRRGFVVPPDRQGAEAQPIKVPAAIKGDSAGFVLDGNRLHLRAVKQFNEGAHHLTVISNVPLTAELLRGAASQLGSVTILPPEGDSNEPPASQAAASTPATLSSMAAPPLHSFPVPDATKRFASRPNTLTVGHATVSLSKTTGEWRPGRFRRRPTASTSTFPLPRASTLSIGKPGKRLTV